MTYLDHTVPAWKAHDGPVCVLGAGGAARAIVHGFLEAGSDEVRVFNRTRERAEQVAEAFGPRVKAFDWNNRSDGARDACVLVNTTGAGLKGGGSLGMDFAGFNEDCVVSDIVYVPLETQLLAQARAHGLRTVDGLGMLLHQAVPGFEKWFGVRPQVTDKLRDIVVADIEGR
jgi:shikimate dehydrogenase